LVIAQICGEASKSCTYNKIDDLPQATSSQHNWLTLAQTEMDGLLDTLSLDIPPPFQSTARYENKIYLCDGLERKPSYRPLLDPLLPNYNNWKSDGSSSSSDEEIVPPSIHIYDGVGSSFGPAGGDPSITFRVNKEIATTPSLREIIVATEAGEEIMRIRPKGRQKNRRRVSRGCVELAVSEWMKVQMDLGPEDPHRHDVRSEILSYNVNGEIKQVSVWLWKGLEQDINRPDIFKIFL